MSREIDRYQLKSLFPICQDCNKIKFDGIPYSCKAKRNTAGNLEWEKCNLSIF